MIKTKTSLVDHGQIRRATRQGLLRAGVAALAVCIAAGASAQDAKKPGTSPVGGAWESKVNQGANSGDSAQTFTPEQSAAVDAVNNYFNQMSNLSGRFVQVDPDKKTTRGKFYVQKPGKFRFDYAAPSRKIVVSDGRFLAIQDLDLRNEDVYQLDNTPFRILLRQDVNILRDARILAITNDPNQVSVTLTEKGPDAAGQITVIIAMQPEPAMTGWVTADAQGLQTQVTVSDLEKPESLDGKLFQREKLFSTITGDGSQ